MATTEITGKYYHLKSGNIYTVLGTVVDATNVCDGQTKVLYENKEGQKFVREISEFLGKFMKIE